jgi:hypothetical protein
VVTRGCTRDELLSLGGCTRDELLLLGGCTRDELLLPDVVQGMSCCPLPLFAGFACVGVNCC